MYQKMALQGQLTTFECHMLIQQASTMELLGMIRDELTAIREATEQANESDPDAEPGPFQTLNGPRL